MPENVASNEPASSSPQQQAQEAWPLHLFRDAVEAAGEGILVTSSNIDLPGPQIEYANPAFAQMSGYTLDEVLNKTPRLLQGPFTDRRVTKAMRNALSEGSPFTGEAINYRKDGSTYLVKWAIAPVRNADGHISHWVSVQSDITARRKSEDALKVSEERLRLIVEGVRDYAIFTTDMDDRVETWLPGAALAYGWNADEIRGLSGAVLFLPEDQQLGVPEQEVEGARAGGSAPNVRWHLRKDGSRVFIEGRVMALHDSDGVVCGFLKVGQDVTERRAAAEMRALLMLEVNHRAMNALAVVQAVLKLTPKTDVRSYSEAAEGRVAALARAQMLLTRSQWTGIELQTLLMNEILPFGHDKAVLIAGPPVLLAPTAAQPVAMVIHELATNATKHGAFSVGTGQVDISWVVLDKPARWIKLRWVESGGPMIPVIPERQGTGTRILNSTICQQLGGTLALFWNTSGLTCEIDLPISRGKSE